MRLNDKKLYKYDDYIFNSFRTSMKEQVQDKLDSKIKTQGQTELQFRVLCSAMKDKLELNQ